MKIHEYLKAVFSSNGGISFGRMASGLALLFVLAWDTIFLFFAMHKMNFQYMHISDVLPPAAALAAQAAFCITFYSVNKIVNSTTGTPSDTK